MTPFFSTIWNGHSCPTVVEDDGEVPINELPGEELSDEQGDPPCTPDGAISVRANTFLGF